MLKRLARHPRFSLLKLILVGLVFWISGLAEAPAATFVTVAPGVISLKGRIELGDCDRWNAAVGTDAKTVILNSPGGRNGQGECISRSIAAKHLRTVVTEKCASICFLLFAAGAEKVVCQGGRIGVHQPRSAETDEDSSDPKFLDKILDYGRRYHVPEDILTKLATTSSRSIYDLTDTDLAAMGVKTCN